MRNPALHAALRDFALEAAALLTDELRDGAELEFDVVDEGDRRGAVLYRYQPRTGPFIAERWPRLRELDTCSPACNELGAGAAAWLRVNGLRGEQAEPALRAMLERLYEDATSFGFPEERFERVYLEVETTLYRDAVRDRVVAPLDGAWMDAERLDLGGGLSLVRRRPRRRARRGGLPRGRRRRARAALRARARHRGARAPRLGGGRERFGRVVTAPAALEPGGGEPRHARLAAQRRRSLDGPSARSERTRPRRRLDAALGRRARPARVRGGDRPVLAPRHDRVGARALRDGLRPHARLRGALRLPARPARAARRHHRAAARPRSRRAWPRCAPRKLSAAAFSGASRRRSCSSASRWEVAGACPRIAARAGPRDRGPRARAAARPVVRLPRRGPEERGRRHPRGDRTPEPEPEPRRASRREAERRGARRPAQPEPVEPSSPRSHTTADEPDEPDPGGEPQPDLVYAYEADDYDTSELEPVAVTRARGRGRPSSPSSTASRPRTTGADDRRTTPRRLRTPPEQVLAHRARPARSCTSSSSSGISIDRAATQALSQPVEVRAVAGGQAAPSS